MKLRNILSKLLLGVLLPAYPIGASAQFASSPESFFLALRQAVNKRDTAALKRLVYPFWDEVEDMQAGMIENMLDGDPLQRGDGAFSMYALDTLIAHHLAEISAVDDDLYAQLAADRVCGSVLSTYAQRQGWIMDFNEVRMIRLKKRGNFQLLCWENLNRLLNPVLRRARNHATLLVSYPSNFT